MLLKGVDGVSIRLWPHDYQYPLFESGDWHDLNWLVIAGDVESPEGRWTFREQLEFFDVGALGFCMPCMLSEATDTSCRRR